MPLSFWMNSFNGSRRGSRARFFFLIPVFLLLTITDLSAAGFRTAVAAYRNPNTDQCRKIVMVNESIDLPYGTISFLNGTLYITGFIDTLPTIAFFVGEGVFVYKPPDPVETQQVHRYYESDSILFPLEEIYFAFPQNSELLVRYFNQGEMTRFPAKDKSRFSYMQRLPEMTYKYNLPLDLYKAAVEQLPDFFWIDMHHQNKHTLYSFNPYQREQVAVSLYRPGFKEPQVVSSISSVSGETPAYLDEYDLYDYNMDINILTYARSSIVCRMALAMNGDSLKVIKFNFPADYAVDSVWGDIADSSAYIKEADRQGLAVQLPRFCHKGDTARINVAYRVNLFYNYDIYSVVQKDMVHWYPHSRYWHQSNFDVTYKIDRGFAFTSVGDKVSDTIIDGKKILQYITTFPVAYLTFDYGIFDSLMVDSSDIPIKIFYISRALNTGLWGSGSVRNVAEDVSRSLRFFSEKFSPYQFSRLDVAEMAGWYGVGAPGIVHLSRFTFLKTHLGVDDLFRAHEVAHQWWGLTVIPKTYHDIWLTEGLAEYSAMLYIQLIKCEEKVFRENLREWKRLITQKGTTEFGKSDGFRAGAIILGDRLASEISPIDRKIMVYYKAAYMLHMLRLQLDGMQPNPTMFMSLLSQFARKFADRMTTSEDFIDVAAEFLGPKTEQFFSQWLYGWQVPKLKKKSKIGADGSVEVIIDVSETGEKFSTIYPIQFKLSDGTIKTELITLTLGRNLFHYVPEAGNKVKSVKFNPDDDILER